MAFDFRDFWSWPIPSLLLGGSLPVQHPATPNMRVLKQNDLVGLFRKNSEDTLSLLPTLA